MEQQWDPYENGIRLGKNFMPDLEVARKRPQEFPALYASFLEAALPVVEAKTIVFLGHTTADIMIRIKSETHRNLIYRAWCESCERIGFEAFPKLAIKIEKAAGGLAFSKPKKIDNFPSTRPKEIRLGSKKGRSHRRDREHKSFSDQVREKLVGERVDPHHPFVAVEGGEHFYGRGDERLLKSNPHDRISFPSISAAEAAGFVRAEGLRIPV